MIKSPTLFSSPQNSGINKNIEKPKMMIVFSASNLFIIAAVLLLLLKMLATVVVELHARCAARRPAAARGAPPAGRPSGSGP